MNEDVLSFTNIRVDNSFLNEIWTLDPRTLEHVDGSLLSSYALALSQYLIYFTYQRNLDKAEQHRLSKYIDRSVSIAVSEGERKFKTKAEAIEHYVTTDQELMEAQTKLEAVQKTLLHIDGMDKVISELIATIKRELTRRENELYQVRVERRN